MSRVVYDFQAAAPSDLFDRLDVARVPVNVRGEDRGGLLRYRVLNLRLVDREVVRIYVDENRRAVLPNDAADRRMDSDLSF